MSLRILIVLILTLILSACNLPPLLQPDVSVEQLWIKEAKVSEITAGDLNQSCICERMSTTNAYLQINNTGWAADRLTSVETDVAVRVDFHQTGVAESLTSPVILDSVEIPAHGQANFAQGSYAMVLKDLKKDLKPGDQVQLSLKFENSGTVMLTAEVR